MCVILHVFYTFHKRKVTKKKNKSGGKIGENSRDEMRWLRILIPFTYIQFRWV